MSQCGDETLDGVGQAFLKRADTMDTILFSITETTAFLPRTVWTRDAHDFLKEPPASCVKQKTMKTPLPFLLGFALSQIVAVTMQAAVVTSYQTNLNLCPLPANFAANIFTPIPSGGAYVSGDFLFFRDDDERRGGSLIVRCDAQGRVVWTNVTEPMDCTVANQVNALDRHENLIMVGTYRGISGATIKYTPTGVPLWTNTFAEYGSQARALALDSSGAVIVGLANVLSDTSDLDPKPFVLVKYRADGRPLWTNRLSVGFTALKTDHAGNIYGSGSRLVSGYFDYERTTMKLTKAGVPVWTNRVDHSGFGTTAVDRFGHVYVASSYFLVIPNQDPFNTYTLQTGVDLFKYGRDGSPVWTNRYDQITTVEALAVDSQGSILLAGNDAIHTTDPTNGIVTLKISARGKTLWSEQAPFGSNRYDYSARFGTVLPHRVTVVQDVQMGGYSTYTVTYRERRP